MYNVIDENMKPPILFLSTYPYPNIKLGYFIGEKMQKQYRPDKEGPRRQEFEKNKKKILISQNICALCGRPVDKNLKFPDPMSPSVDHIIPIDKGGDPSKLDNLQLTHLCCNRQKSDKIVERQDITQKIINNRDLPLSRDWTKYRYTS